MIEQLKRIVDWVRSEDNAASNEALNALHIICTTPAPLDSAHPLIVCLSEHELSDDNIEKLLSFIKVYGADFLEQFIRNYTKEVILFACQVNDRRAGRPVVIKFFRENYPHIFLNTALEKQVPAAELFYLAFAREINEVLDDLISNRLCDVNMVLHGQEENALLCATRMNRYEQVKFLLQYKNVQYAKDSEGKGVFHYALEHKNLALLTLLMEHYPRFQAGFIAHSQGHHPVHLAVQYRFDRGALTILEKSNIPVASILTPKASENVAHLCCNMMMHETLVWLYENHRALFAVNAVNSEGRHVGHYFASQSQATQEAFDFCMKNILTPKIMLSKDKSGLTTLDIALAKGQSHWPMVRACLDKLAEVTGYQKQKEHQEALANLKQIEALCVYFSDAENIALTDSWLFLRESKFLAVAYKHMSVKSLSNIRDFGLIPQLKDMLTGLIHEGQIAKAIAILSSDESRYQEKDFRLDDEGTTLLQFAVETGELEFVAHCTDTLKLDCLIIGKAHASALDMAVFKRSLDMVKKLWGALTPERQEEYLNAQPKGQQKAKKEKTVAFLKQHGLHEAPQNRELQMKAKTGQCSELQFSLPPMISPNIAEYIEKTRELFNKLNLLNIDDKIDRMEARVICMQIEALTASDKSHHPFCVYARQSIQPLSEKILIKILEILRQASPKTLVALIANHKATLSLLICDHDSTGIYRFFVTYFPETFLSPVIDGQSFTESFFAMAVNRKAFNLIKYFLEERICDINDPVFYQTNSTALLYAVKHEVVPLFELLMTYDGVKCAWDKSESGLFEYAFRAENKAILKALIQAFDVKFKADFTAFYERNNKDVSHPIHLAIAHGLVDNVEIILSESPECIDLLAPSGLNLVAYACVKNQPQVANWLIDNYSSLEINTLTQPEKLNIAHLCCESQALSTLPWLMRQYPHLFEARAYNGSTPLLWAAEKKAYVVLFNLLWDSENKHLYDVTTKNNQGKHVGHYFAEDIEQINLITPAIMQLPIKVLAKDNRGQTMLDIALAAGRSHYPIVRVCLDKLQTLASQKEKEEALTRLSGLKQRKALYVYLSDVKNLTIADGWLLNVGPLLTELYGHLPVRVLLDLTRFFELKPSDIFLGLVALRFMDKACAFIGLNAEKFKQETLDSRGTNLLMFAVEQRIVSLVEYCATTLKLSCLVQRSHDKCSALDMAVKLQSKEMTTILWQSLLPLKQKKYIASAKTSPEDDARSMNLRFLTECGLYQAEEVQEAEQAPVPLVAQAAPHIDEVSSNPIENESTNQVTQEIVSEKPEKQLIDITTLTKEDLLLCAQKEGATKYFKRLKNLTGIQEVLQPWKKELYAVATAGVKGQLTKIIGPEEAVEQLPDLMVDTTQKDTLFDAVERKDYNFIASLRQNRDFDKELVEHRISLLKKAIECGDTLMVYSLLSIPVVKAGVSYELLEHARTYSKEVYDHLLKMPGVQNTLPAVNSPFKPIPTEHIQTPKCFEIPTYRTTIEIITDSFKYLPAKIKTYLYGSANYKALPGDLDILVPETALNDEESIKKIVEPLIAKGAKVFKEADGMYGHCMPKNAPQRRVIPMELNGVRLEIIITPKTLAQHASSLDFTLSAMYFDLKNWSFSQQEGAQGAYDYQYKIIDTTKHPSDVFRQDITTVFRAIQMLAIDPSLTLSARCEEEIKRMFSGDDNPFLTYKVLPKRLYQKLDNIYLAGCSGPALDLLHKYNILTHLVSYLKTERSQDANHINALSRVEQYYMKTHMQQPVVAASPVQGQGFFAGQRGAVYFSGTVVSGNICSNGSNC